MIRVKICGITTVEDACAAARAGADLLGFVFYPSSPRYITPERAGEIIRTLRQSFEVRTVGVFVNEPAARIRQVVEQCGLDDAQLSGDEQASTLRELSHRAYKALRPRDPDALGQLLADYGPAARGRAPALLVDAYHPQLFGGTGERADWSQARGTAIRFPILLAGGLNAENVTGAIDAVQPWGVDVSSGVERAPGLKDHQKLQDFISRVKGYSI